MKLRRKMILVFNASVILTLFLSTFNMNGMGFSSIYGRTSTASLPSDGPVETGLPSLLFGEIPVTLYGVIGLEAYPYLGLHSHLYAVSVDGLLQL